MINELRSFIKFAENGLESIEISTDQFLEHIKILELETNKKLIKYIAKQHIVLTNFGKLFLVYAKKTLSTLEESLNLDNDSNLYDIDNNITIGLTTESAMSWVVGGIKNFNKMHPGLRLAAISDDCITQKIIDNSTIIFWGIDGDPDPRILEKYDKIWFVEYKHVLFASTEYIKKYGEPTLDNIKKHKIIAYSGKDQNYMLANWHVSGKYGAPSMLKTFQIPSRDLVSDMIVAGIGIGSMSENCLNYYKYKGLRRVLRSVDGPIFKSYFFVRKGLNEQMRCNIELISGMFQRFLTENSIPVFKC